MKESRRNFIKRSGVATLVAVNTIMLTGLVDAQEEYYSGVSPCRGSGISTTKCCDNEFGSAQHGYKCEKNGTPVDGYCQSDGSNWHAGDCTPPEE